MQHCYVKNNRLWCVPLNDYIKQVAVLVDIEADGIIKYGETMKLMPYLIAYQKIPYLTGVMLIELGSLSVDEQAYVINRMMNYTASGFVKKFVQKMYDGSAKEWLQAEMKDDLVSC